MFRAIRRNLLWAYALLMLVAAIGYAKYDNYMMDGDGTAFMDIAQDLRTGHAGLAINGYWNPGYPAVLAVAEDIAHPSLWNELVVVRYADVAIFAMAMAACFFFTTSLSRARRLRGDADRWAVPEVGLHLLGLGLLTLSLSRELPIAAPRSDTLLLVFLLTAMALLLRLCAGAGFWAYPALGLALGCGYLTKSFAFIPSVLLLCAVILYGLLRRSSNRTRTVLGGLVAFALFGATAGPYIAAISHQLGHLTTGDSARLNYAFFIDNTPRWHEWYYHQLGHARGPFTHAERLIAGPPPVFSFAAHPYGTFPLWFDPAWWTAGLKPHIYLRGHISRLLRNCVVFVRYLLGRPEPLLLLAVAIAFGAKWPPMRTRPRTTYFWALAPVAWGVLMLAIYFPIDLQDRYLTAPFLMVLIPCFAVLRLRPDDAPSGPLNKSASIALALIVLFAVTTLGQTATYLAESRRLTPPAEQRHPGFRPEFFNAAGALQQLGLRPGDTVACMGDRTCYTDYYWARLAGAQILAQVETPNGDDPQAVWNSIPNPQSITDPLRRMGLQYIVTTFANSAHKPDGWIQLGHSNLFAYPLQQKVSAQKQAAVSAYQATP